MVNSSQTITIVGGGLAGSECALQLANKRHKVVLYEMRPHTSTPAHKTSKFAELVCSNSLGSLGAVSAPGQLKWEAQLLKSFLLTAAHEAYVSAGQALAVDREKLSEIMSRQIENHPYIEVRRERVDTLADLPRPAVIATGPLTEEHLAQELQNHFGNEFLYFFDAIAPIIDADTINRELVWKADRYDKGSPDYINCPLSKDEYFKFVVEVLNSRKITPKEFEQTPFFEGCMPIETMVERGPQTLRFGPMKPVGLKNPKTGREPYAVVQLRSENKEESAYNMVGFQTRMAYPEQERVFRMIPGLEKAEFLKLGSMHRNLFIHSPSKLNKNLSSKLDENLYFAGQITGVEGYFESTCMGLLVAHFIDQKLKGSSFSQPPPTSAMGALLHSITDESRAKHFQPTNINFGLLPQPPEFIKDKTLKKQKQLEIAKRDFQDWILTQ